MIFCNPKRFGLSKVSKHMKVQTWKINQNKFGADIIYGLPQPISINHRVSVGIGDRRTIGKGLAANKGGSLYQRFFLTAQKLPHHSPALPPSATPFSISLLGQIGSDLKV